VPSPEIYRKLRIFIACPSDVSAEKDRLPAIVNRLKTVANESGFFLDLLEWRNVVPDMGRPQEIIFSQSEPKSWDIFIGILWQRFGSPSGAVNPNDNVPFESGTQEEFEIAHKLWKKYNWPRILFYRCTRSVNVNLDPEQLSRVQKFIAEFTPQGVHPGIYKAYESIEQFAELAYDHISTAIKDAAKETAKVSALKSDLERDLSLIEEQKTTATTSTRDLVVEAIERIERLYEGGSPGLPTGFVQFDQITGGLHPCELVVIAGPPGIGKTALAMNIAEHVAFGVGKSIGYFTLEMSSFQVVQRLFSSMAKVDIQKIRQGFLSERDFPALTAAASKLAGGRLFIDDSPALSAANLRSKAQSLKAENDIQLIVIDYLQLLRPTLQGDRQSLASSELTPEIKALAKELMLPIILVVSTSLRRSKMDRPRLEDFKDLDPVVRDADVVGLLFRGDYRVVDDEEAEKEAGNAELIIEKQRNGPTGTVMLTFRREFVRFENRAIEHRN
jgi:replicative DNA helicase